MSGLRRWRDDDEWNGFVARSPQGSVFTTTPFLQALGVDFDLWRMDDDEIGGLAVVVLKDPTGTPAIAPFAFSLYQGPMFDAAFAALPTHRRVHAGLRLMTGLIDALEQQYDRISFCLHYEFPDIRAFSWFHYHAPECGQFTTGIFYTGIIDLTQWPTFEAYLADIRMLRRRDRLKALRHDYQVEDSSDLNLFKSLYQSMFARQQVDVDEATLCRMVRIASMALTHGFADLLVCRTKEGEPAAAALFMRDQRSAYYLIGANAPGERGSGAATLVLLEHIRRCYERGIPRVDMVGINSPNRGDFKTSFNATPVPYFVVSWDRPQAAAGLEAMRS